VKLFWWLVGGALLLGGAAVPARCSSLTIAAAADLAAAEGDLTSSFHRVYPEYSVRFVFGASGALTQQIANGAPYDVFLSANEAFVDQLAVSRKLLPATVHIYALGKLGILWRDGKPHPFNDLKENWVRLVALPNPKLAPYGVAAQQALEQEHLWDAIRSRIVFGENVRQALQILESGNADVVLTSFSLLVGHAGAAEVPAAWHKPILQKAGVVAASANAEGGRRFLAFLGSPAGAAILRQHGLEPVAK
jgi:molybdate transport system substrate-binding protein